MRYRAITPHLAFIRETHRLVLSWTRFDGTDVRAFTVTLRKQDLIALRDARVATSTDWRSADGRLEARGDRTALILTFSEPGGADSRALELTGAELESFDDAVESLAGNR